MCWNRAKQTLEPTRSVPQAESKYPMICYRDGEPLQGLQEHYRAGGGPDGEQLYEVRQNLALNNAAVLLRRG